MARAASEFGWWMGGELPQRSISEIAGPGREHGITDVVGADGADRGGRRDKWQRHARRSMAPGAADEFGGLGRRCVDWKRISESFLSEVLHVSALFSADGAGRV